MQWYSVASGPKCCQTGTETSPKMLDTRCALARCENIPWRRRQRGRVIDVRNASDSLFWVRYAACMRVRCLQIFCVCVFFFQGTFKVTHCGRTQMSPGQEWRDSLKIAQRESIITHMYAHTGPQDTSCWHAHASTFPHTHAWINVTQQPLVPPALHNSPSLHLSFTALSFYAISPGLCSLSSLSLHPKLPVSPLFFKTPPCALTHPRMDPFPFSLTLMNHSLSLKSPIISDGMASDVY